MNHLDEVNENAVFFFEFECHDLMFKGDNFVTRKITRSVAKIFLNQQQTLELGSLDSKRDWGHAKDFIEAMWLMLQQDKPDDFVIATGNKPRSRDEFDENFFHSGETHSVREFVEAAFEEIGRHIV